MPDGVKRSPGEAFTPALCHVHHVRELTVGEEERTQVWAKKREDLLRERNATGEQAKTQGQHAREFPERAEFLRRSEEILAEGYQLHPPPPPPQKSERPKRKPGRAKQSTARTLLDRFSVRQQAVRRFVFDGAVPF